MDENNIVLSYNFPYSWTTDSYKFLIIIFDFKLFSLTTSPKDKGWYFRGGGNFLHILIILIYIYLYIFCLTHSFSVTNFEGNIIEEVSFTI